MPKKRRKVGSKQIEKRLFIICEGAKDKSESIYFKKLISDYSLNNKKVKVQVLDFKRNTGKELINFAKKNRELKDDILWVVYDKDGYTKHAETFLLAQKYKVNIAFSAISFEFWILLHFEYTTRAFNKSEDIIKYLFKNFQYDYSKKKLSTYDDTKYNLNEAMRNAKKIQSYQIQNNETNTPIYKFNPYTNINVLIKEITVLLKMGDSLK